MQSKNLLNEESGDILVIFALVFTVLMGIVSLCVDVGIMYMQRSEMVEIAQIMRDTRFDVESGNAELMHSDKPGKVSFMKMNDLAQLNNFNGKVSVSYYEYQSTSTGRSYKVRISLSDTYKCTTLRVLGFEEIPLNIVIDGYGTKRGYTWKPYSVDNGTYTATNGGIGYTYTTSIPNEWR